jgi:hypothetical protein
VHGLPLKVPSPELAKLTVPVGVDEIPVSVSFTVAVQVVVLPTLTVDGTHDTVVDVERVVTVTGVVPELVEWAESPL